MVFFSISLAVKGAHGTLDDRRHCTHSAAGRGRGGVSELLYNWSVGIEEYIYGRLVNDMEPAASWWCDWCRTVGTAAAWPVLDRSVRTQDTGSRVGRGRAQPPKQAHMSASASSHPMHATSAGAGYATRTSRMLGQGRSDSYSGGKGQIIGPLQQSPSRVLNPAIQKVSKIKKL